LFDAAQCERAREAALLYRELLSTHPDVQAQRLAFDRALADYRRTQPAGDLEGRSFTRFLENIDTSFTSLLKFDDPKGMYTHCLCDID